MSSPDITAETAAAEAAATVPPPNETKANRMYVIKRNGAREDVFIDTITTRIRELCYGLDTSFVDPVAITLCVVKGLYAGVKTRELDRLAADTAASFITKHADYGWLAARLAISNLHRETDDKFSTVISRLRHMRTKAGEWTPMISEKHHAIVMANADRLDKAIDHDRDFRYNYFGFRTLEQSYLLKIDGKVVERPQYMLMRVAVGIWGDDIKAALQAYDYMSRGIYTHATPTLYSAATVQPQLSSCFLTGIAEDSIESIFDTVKRAALISKSAGGIGMEVHRIRGKGAYIAGTNGTSRGLVPMLRVYNTTAMYVDQGGNKRPGAFAMYLEPWHVDVVEFLDLRKNIGSDDNRARALFTGLWIPDLFMQRVKDNLPWSLMCPKQCADLADLWGEEFDKRYAEYEKAGCYVRQISARSLWHSIYVAQIETGGPYMLYKDACNRKSNQQNLGTIRCSNLCTEIIQYTSPTEVAVCNLASIALNSFVIPATDAVASDTTTDGTSSSSPPMERYDFAELHKVTKMVTQNLNRVIDVNSYPVPEARTSNMRHRPIGIGVQGLADVFIMLRYPYDSAEARLLNRQIFETIYHAALEASCELAERDGPYETYDGSPVSRGILQYDMWDVKPTDLWDWATLKAKIAQHGVRNSLLVAPMPTASTAQILGNAESFEPYTSNAFMRRVKSGDFQVVNPHLVADLSKLGLWNDDMRNAIVAYGGSIQNIETIPKDLKLLYRTVWEISIKSTIEMAADRGAFVDQSQSFNLYVAKPDYNMMTSIHFDTWKYGLKTGMYYLRTKPAANAIAFTVDKSRLRQPTTPPTLQTIDEEPTTGKTTTTEAMCLRDSSDCLMCGS